MAADLVAHLLGAEALHLEYPTRVVFDSVTLGVAEGDRIGVVGRNGDGKSSLLGLLSGNIEPTEGRVMRRGGLRFGMLSQTDDLDPDATAQQAIVGDRPEHEWAGDPRIRDIIEGLAADIDWHTRIAELSGGQRRRVALAALLVGDWDLIALDEPNNSMGCSFRTPRFYRRGRATSRPDTRRRARGRRSVVPCRTVPVGRGGR